MIEPLHSMAFSIHSNPGVYAILLGSGVSRPAKIPTGWELTLELISKLAALYGETCGGNPELWYRNRFSREPDYSNILNELAKTPAERQQLLRGYWEPTEQEREDGEKLPTLAHRALAALVTRGFIRVIITTNFDRLMETALADEGIVPTVLSSVDQIKGALPLIHTKCCVLKIHGDYLDTRIRNTSSELDDYPTELNRYLDRVFDEFGLIVCGWSAEWDSALCAALFRASSRRFTTYWTTKGELTDRARKITDHRRATVVQIEDADTLFQGLEQHIKSIDQFSNTHPLSSEVAIASLKRFISDNRYRIQLSDLIEQEVERVVDLTLADDFAVQGTENPTIELVSDRAHRYYIASSTLLAMAPIGGYWANDEHYMVWERALQRLGSRRSDSGFIIWLELQRLPGTLLLYALGLGAVESKNLRFLKRLLGLSLRRMHRDDVEVAKTLPAQFLTSDTKVAKVPRDSGTVQLTLYEWIREQLRPHSKSILPDDNQYLETFLELEILIALNCGYMHNVRPLGSAGYKYDQRNRILGKIKDSISHSNESCPYVNSGLFGTDSSTCLTQLDEFIQDCRRVSPW